ncbi:hypothetical protein B0H14DRAFT_3475013 [Mycena olivaceomarginata]|nr:hypothetical protein B0H14DRAFT_3475013 [Mycena olivaceomarginata]
MAEIVGLVASVLQLVNMVAGATSAIQRFEQPLKTLEETMKQLAQKLQPNGPIRKLFTRLTWLLWGKDDVHDGWLNVCLGMDIWDFTRGASSAVKDVGEKVDRTVHSAVAVGRDQQKYRHDIISTMTHTAEEQQISHNGEIGKWFVSAWAQNLG